MSKKKIKKRIDWISAVLLIVGGLVHLGLAFNFNAVQQWLGFSLLAQQITYGLVGASAVWTLIQLFRKKYMK